MTRKDSARTIFRSDCISTWEGNVDDVRVELTLDELGDMIRNGRVKEFLALRDAYIREEWVAMLGKGMPIMDIYSQLSSRYRVSSRWIMRICRRKTVELNSQKVQQE
jgi:hypothetical protein